LWNFKEIRQ